MVLFAVGLVSLEISAISVSVIVVAVVGAVIGFVALHNSAISDYANEEVKWISTLMDSRETSEIVESGLATRIESAKLAILGVWNYPFGLGCDGRKTYYSRHWYEVYTTPEMEEWADQGVYGGKSYFFNALGDGGILATLCLLRLIYISAGAFRFPGHRGSIGVPAAITAGLVTLSLSTELMPFVGICGLVYSAGVSLQRRYANVKPDRPRATLRASPA